MKSQVTFIYCFLILFLLLSSSCSKEDDKNNSSGLRYTGYVPNFSVNIPNRSINSNSFLSLLPRQVQLLELEENEINIDCTTALNNANVAPRFPNDPSSNGNPFCGEESDQCHENELGFATRFYADTQFYDCNARQQLREDGLSVQCNLREGSEGSIGEDNLCDEESITTTQLLYAFSVGETPDDLTRFVSWTMDPNDPETVDVEGRMINKYLEDNGRRTKTRVDLDRENGKKAVDTVFILQNSSNEPIVLKRVYFREAGSGDDVTDNYIVGRVWDVNYGKVIAVRAHLRSSVGASVFVNRCDASDFTAAQTSDCTSSTETAIYFNANGEQVTEAPSGLLTDGRDANFNPRDSDEDTLDTFFNGGTIDTYFNPSTFSPENDETVDEEVVS